MNPLWPFTENPKYCQEMYSHLVYTVTTEPLKHPHRA